MYNSERTLHTEPDNGTEHTEPQRPAPARRNPRLVIGNLDYFEMLMEQEEE